MEPEGSVLYSQKSATDHTLTQLNPVHTLLP
jgi:hypothetical protein